METAHPSITGERALAQAAAQVAAAAPGAEMTEREHIAGLQRELAEATERRVLAERELALEQTKRVRAESELQWLQRELKALSDRLSAEMTGLAMANWRNVYSVSAETVIIGAEHRTVDESCRTDRNAAPAT